jgi:hypothetical protein
MTGSLWITGHYCHNDYLTGVTHILTETEISRDRLTQGYNIIGQMSKLHQLISCKFEFYKLDTMQTGWFAQEMHYSEIWNSAMWQNQ